MTSKDARGRDPQEPAGSPAPGDATTPGPLGVRLTAENRRRVAAASPFVVVGLLCIIAAGFLSAVAGALPAKVDTSLLSWATAYLVLVAGIAAIGFGVGQALLGKRAPASGLVTVELVAFYAGNAAVLAGSLASQPVVTDVGGALLVFSIILFIIGARGSRGTRLRWALYTYRALLVIILVSIPIGLALSHLRVG